MNYFHDPAIIPKPSDQHYAFKHAGGPVPSGMPLRPIQPAVPDSGIYYSSETGYYTPEFGHYHYGDYGVNFQEFGYNEAQYFYPDPDKTPTPEKPLSLPGSSYRKVHAWRDRSECPQPSGMYVPPPMPNPDVYMQLEVGDVVRVKPWTDQFTWIEGRVDKLDFSIASPHKATPRCVVSYTHPDSGHVVRRFFSPYLSEITVKEAVLIVPEPLPVGIDRYLYVCIPPLYSKKDGPLEKIWTKAQVLTAPDGKNTIKIRVLVGPSKNVLFNNFSLTNALPYTRESRVWVIKQGYAVEGRDEHPKYQFNVQ